MDDTTRQLQPEAVYSIRFWLLVGSGIGCLAVGAVALASGVGALPLPDPLAALDMRLPIIFRIHMLAGGFGLAFLPLAFAIRRVAPTWHRALGRAVLVALLIASFAGIASAAASIATPLARAGFAAQGAMTVVLSALAWRAVRRKHVATHARLMQAVAAVVSGAIVLRLGIWLAVSLKFDFDASYALLAWASWLAPLAGVAAWQWLGSGGWALRCPRLGPISLQSGR